MAAEFGLYCRKTKDFIWLGKACNIGFQMPDEIIAQFIKEHIYDEPFEIKSDLGDLPEHEEEGWTCHAEWHDYEAYQKRYKDGSG